MIKKDVKVLFDGGLHTKRASEFVHTANSFKSSIRVEKDERTVNAKSMLGLLSLGINEGYELSLVADGSDEEAAIRTLSSLLENK